MINKFIFLPIYSLLLFICLNNPVLGAETAYKTKDSYLNARNNLIDSAKQLRFDSAIVLSPAEQKADAYISKLKEMEFARNEDYFPPAHNFYEAKPYIDNSPLLEVFHKMPKGAILHLHPPAMGDFRWLISYATYLPNCYIYTGTDTDTLVNGSFHFFKKDPGRGWELVSELRSTAENKNDFDEKLYQSITLGQEDLAKKNIWTEFEKCFKRSGGLINYLPVFGKYYRNAFLYYIADNIQYLELRAGLYGIYDLDGKTYGADKFIEIYKKILNDINTGQPKLGVKLIYSCHRHADKKTIMKELRQALKLRRKYPDFIIGFDLVGEEDKGYDYLYFIDNFIEITKEEEKLNIDLPYYFHSGESDWFSDNNMYDAILLNSKRIGHGYNLFMHPSLYKPIKEKDIPLEICPISNQVLGYIEDLRCHPAINYLNSGLPFVLSPDDPGIMGYNTVTYDYYEAFMAWDLDLKSLKQLALNSIKYSTMNKVEQEKALYKWQNKWKTFILWLNEKP